MAGWVVGRSQRTEGFAWMELLSRYHRKSFCLQAQCASLNGLKRRVEPVWGNSNGFMMVPYDVLPQ